MEIQVYRARAFDHVPQNVHVTFDSLDDRYYAAFEKYPDTEKLVVVGWGTTGEVAGDPLVVLVLKRLWPAWAPCSHEPSPLERLECAMFDRMHVGASARLPQIPFLTQEPWSAPL